MKSEWTHVTQPYVVGNFSDTIVKQSVQLITTGADIPVITTMRKSCIAVFCCSTNGRCIYRCEDRKMRMVVGRGSFYLTSWLLLREGFIYEGLDFYVENSLDVS